MASDNRVGEVLASKYRLEELLGSGGMGHVYRAVNEHVGRAVAIKVLRAEHAENAMVVDRFLREARAANLVRHPNVVDVLDIGKEDGGAPFIVQELLDGEDLAHLVARRGGKLPLEEALDLLLPVIDAVAEAHLRGVIHRDIKPENVFLAKSGRAAPVPKLLDFGISKVRAPDLRATEVGLMMGTPAYMAPEQIQGSREADPRSDVWALGVMMFEIIAGRMPFDAQDAPALFVTIATRDAPTLLDVKAEVTPPVSRVVERCLRRRPDERYPSAAELGRDLRHVMDGTELEATGKRSIPPELIARANEAAALGKAPTSLAKLAAEAAANDPAPPAVAPVPEAPDLPEAPSLVPPPPRASTSRQARVQAPAAASAPAAPSRSLEPPPGSRLVSTASLPGVMMPPGSSVRRPSGSHESWGVKGRDERADMSPIIGLGVVGLVTILGVGLLMQLAHRPEGWPVARFVVPPTSGIALAIHGGLAAAVAAIGITYFLRALRHWRGELGGGAPNAIFSAVVAAIAFFSAIELVSAVS